MPTPFPGMDPYLEDPATWPNLHHGLIAEIKSRITADLRPRYYARAEERVYVSDEGDPARNVYIPDIRVVHPPRHGSADWTPREGGTDLAEGLEVTTLIHDEIHERRVEVIAAVDRSVVAVIEILSPTNKVPGSPGRESYRQKRTDVLLSQSHWIEIDLLRAGQRTIPTEALPFPGDYLIHVSRVQRRPRGRVWPIRLQDKLPSIGIPLKPGDPDYPLDLQAILNAAYDHSAYDLEIDYTREPPNRLTPEQAAWADQLLREKGLRTA